MGANTETYNVRAKDQKTLKLEYLTLQENALYDNGHSGYTGTIAESPGLTVLNIELTVDEAEDYIFENAKKWENSLAIKIKDTKDQWMIGGCYSS